jgi:hypothetical protein
VTFEVPLSAVSRSRTPRSVLAVAAGSTLIVLGAVAAGALAPSTAGSPGSRPAAVRGSAPPAAASPAFGGLVFGVEPTPPFEPAGFNRPLPTAIDCHAVASAQCRRIVRAALRILPDDLPSVGSAQVWGSLVCNDNFDCPSDYLRDAEPAGSVFVGFGDGSPRVTVNVVDWGYGTAVRLGLRAWMVPTY